MTTSPEPWTLGPNNQILDATGELVAIFKDGRDADRCLRFTGNNTKDKTPWEEQQQYRKLMLEKKVIKVRRK